MHRIYFEFETIFTVCHTSKTQPCHSNLKTSQELLNLAKKSDLLEIASHYSIPSVKTSILKHEIKNIIIQFFVDEEIFEPSATSHIMVSQTDIQLRELEIKRQLELEKMKLEFEERSSVSPSHFYYGAAPCPFLQRHALFSSALPFF